MIRAMLVICLMAFAVRCVYAVHQMTEARESARVAVLKQAAE